MKIEDKKVIEIFLGLILIIALIILILLFAQPSSAKPTNQQTTTPIPQNIIITNSYNTNSYNSVSYEKPSSKIYRTYQKKDYDDEFNKSYMSWSSREIKNGIFGHEVSRYVVYLKNTGEKGKYFRVRFNFEDCYDKKNSDSITKYVFPRDKEKFVYTDIKNRYCDWEYEILN